MTTIQIKSSISAANVKYSSVVYRGVEYTVSYSKFNARWELHSNRLGYGRFNVGSYKFFSTWSELQSKCKAFAGVELIDVM